MGHQGPSGSLKTYSAPYSPERHISVIETCVKACMDTIILDSVTHEWENLLDTHASMTGNSLPMLPIAQTESSRMAYLPSTEKAEWPIQLL